MPKSFDQSPAGEQMNLLSSVVVQTPYFKGWRLRLGKTRGSAGLQVDFGHVGKKEDQNGIFEIIGR